MEERTCGSSPGNREEVHPDRLIAHHNYGVVDGSAVKQVALSTHHSCVSGRGDRPVIALHFFATVVCIIHLAIIIAIAFGGHSHVAFRGIIILYVAVGFIRLLLTLALASSISLVDGPDLPAPRGVPGKSTAKQFDFVDPSLEIGIGVGTEGGRPISLSNEQVVRSGVNRVSRVQRRSGKLPVHVYLYNFSCAVVGSGDEMPSVERNGRRGCRGDRSSRTCRAAVGIHQEGRCATREQKQGVRFSKVSHIAFVNDAWRVWVSKTGYVDPGIHRNRVGGVEIRFIWNVNIVVLPIKKKRLPDLACVEPCILVRNQVLVVILERTVVVVGGDVFRIPIPRPPTYHAEGWCSTTWGHIVRSQNWPCDCQRQTGDDNKAQKESQGNIQTVTIGSESLAIHGFPPFEFPRYRLPPCLSADRFLSRANRSLAG